MDALADDRAAWPTAVRVAADLCLGAAQPTALFGGRGRRLIACSAAYTALVDAGPWRDRQAAEFLAGAWPSARQICDAVLADGAGRTAIECIGHPDGTTRHYELALTALRGDDGVPSGILLTCLDRTAQVEERRGLEEELARRGVALREAQQYRESAIALAQVRAIFNHAPVGLAILDLSDDFLCIEHNPALLSLLHEDVRRRGTAIGLSAAGILDPASFQAVRALFTGVRDTGQPVTIDEFPVSFPPDPLPRFYMGSIVPLRDQHGHIESLLIAALEVTGQVRSRLRIEELAAQAEARAAELSAVIGAITDGVVVFDAEGQVLLLNDAGRAIVAALSVSPPSPQSIVPLVERLGHLTLRDPLTGRRFRPEETAIVRALAGETVANFLTLLDVPGNGHPRWITASATPLRARDGAVRGAVASFRDVSREKESEREKDEFLTVASHELKTPLTGVIGMIEMADRRLRRQESERAAEALRQAQAQAERMQALIADLLDLGRLQGGQIVLKTTRIDLVSAATVAMGRIRATTSRHTVRFDAPGEAVWVEADGIRIDQVFDNLLGNAVKYAPAGGEILVRVARSEEEAVVYVHDQGIGIPSAGRDRLFERFYRAGNSGVRPFAGLGMGLWICGQVLALHQGRIWLEETGETGSTFAFSLPLATTTH